MPRLKTAAVLLVYIISSIIPPMQTDSAMSNKPHRGDTGTLAGPDQVIDSGRRTLQLEAQALAQTAALLSEEPLRTAFVALCEAILHCEGRIITMGVGKSGHIAGKIAATLASTGTLAHFIHPSEAAHGDLGAVDRPDLVLMLSKSGSSAELEQLLPALRQLRCRLTCLCCQADSPLAAQCEPSLVVPVEQEACPNNLAPTTSTTMMLALGDAIATSVLAMRGFSSEAFALSHPAGRLGRQLLLTAADLMRPPEALPLVTEDSPMADALLEITAKELGMAVVVDKSDRHRATGIMTDGDLRRCLSWGQDIHRIKVADMMTRDFRHIPPHTLALDALNTMQSHSISCLPVVQADKLLGALTLHDALRANLR